MRIEQLIFTRFVAALAILAYHFGRPLNIFSIIRLFLKIKQFHKNSSLTI